MKMQYWLVPNDQKRIRFVNKDTGETEEPLDVLALATHGKCRIVKESRFEKITTELKAFGAPEDGIYTVLGQVECDVIFTLVVEIAEAE